jgi:hypothetical protein
METIKGKMCEVCKKNHADGIATGGKLICIECLFKDDNETSVEMYTEEKAEKMIPVIVEENIKPPPDIKKQKKSRKQKDKKIVSLSDLF